MTNDPVSTFTALQGHIGALMNEHGVPGVAVGVLYHDETYTAGLGVTNMDHPLPITDETLFQIGSISKTFTGTLIMQMVEAGELELDAPVRRYLPDFKLADEDAAARATVRHLLTHMGNWVGDFFIDTGEGDDASARYVERMANLPQLAPLGTVWSYNNAGFYLAGHLIETVTGQTFEKVLRTRLLEPLGMEQVYLRPTEVMPLRFATGHRVTDGKAEVAKPWPLPRACQAAGGIITNVHELLRYARFQMGDGSIESEDGTSQTLLSPHTMAQMQSPQVTRWGEDETMGLTWFIDDGDGVRRISHGGGTTGQISLLALVPEDEFAIALVTNGSVGGRITMGAYRWAIEQYLGVQPVIPAPIASPREKLAELAGKYERPLAEIELRMEDDRLMLHMMYKAGFPTEDVPAPPSPPPAACTLCAADRLIVLEGPLKDSLIDIFRDETGRVLRIRMGRIYNRA